MQLGGGALIRNKPMSVIRSFHCACACWLPRNLHNASGLKAIPLPDAAAPPSHLSVGIFVGRDYFLLYSFSGVHGNLVIKPCEGSKSL